MKIKCKDCGTELRIPDGACEICFADVLYELCEIENIDERFEKISDFINELTDYDYERGIHNALCGNYLWADGNGHGWNDIGE